MDYKIKIVNTDLIKGIYVQHYFNWKERLFYLMSIEEFNENNCQIPEFKIDDLLPYLSDEEEVYVKFYEMKKDDKFKGDLLTPSQLEQIKDYIWRTIPI